MRGCGRRLPLPSRPHARQSMLAWYRPTPQWGACRILNGVGSSPRSSSDGSRRGRRRPRRSVDKYIQQTGLQPDPWLTGAITCVLPELGNTRVDWNASLGTLSQEEIVAFLADAYTLISAAIRARDAGGHGVTKVLPPGEHPVVPWDDPIPAFDREVNVSS